MTSTLFGRKLHHHAGLLLTMTLGLCLFEVFLIWVTAQLEQGFGLAALLEQLLPAAMRQAFAAQFGFISFAGAVAFGFQHPFTMVTAVAFVVVAGTIPAAERETGLLDLILARAASRTRYLLSNLALMLIGSLLLPAALLFGASVGLALVEVQAELPWYRYAASAGGLVALLLAVGGFTLLIAVASRRRGSAAARAAGLSLGLFVLDFLGSQWEWLGRFRWLSPFYYYKPVPAAVIPLTPIENPLVLLTIFLLTSVGALILFRRLDL